MELGRFSNTYEIYSTIDQHDQNAARSVIFVDAARSTGNTHGTGCTLAAAIAAELAKGAAPLDAVRAAKVFLTELLRASAGLQIGTGVQRPMNHG